MTAPRGTAGRRRPSPARLAHAAFGTVKRAVVAGLGASGVLDRWKATKLRRRPIVLTYHRVLAPEACHQSWSHPSIIVSRPTFAMHMQVLRQAFRVVSLDEFVRRIESNAEFEPNSCLVTFDDGWRDTYAEAWPILKAHGVPAVVFLSTGFIGGNRMFWQEELGAALLEAWGTAREDASFRRQAHALLSAHGLERMLTAGEPDSREMALGIVRAVKQRGGDTGPLVEALRGLNGGRPRMPVDAFMDWNQVKEMYAGGIAFGGHGVSHRLLPTLPADEVRDEVRRSRRDIEDHLGGGVTSFAYPNGDRNPGVDDAVRDAGYAVAFGTTEGPVDPTERYTLRRVNIHEGPTAVPSMFLARIVGAI